MTFVTPGGIGQLMASPVIPGLVWTVRASPQNNTWTCVCFGNNQFVAVASDGTNQVMTSPDGITWTLRNAAEANAWQSVCWGNNLYVAVANSGTNRVMTSPDGVTWTARPAIGGTGAAWKSVAYGNGLYVAVGSGTLYKAMSSPDGITWTTRTIATQNFIDVIYGERFVAVSDGSGSSGGGYVFWSTNGVDWSTNTATASGTYVNYSSVAYGNGTYVTVATNAQSSAYSRVSISTNITNSLTWTDPVIGTLTWQSVAFGGRMFAGVAQEGWIITSAATPPALIPTSPWKSFAAPVLINWTSVCFGNGRFVAVASSGSGNRVMTSP